MNAAVHRPALSPSVVRRQRAALAISCALHLLLIALLLWKLPTPVTMRLELRRAPITLDLLPFAKPAAPVMQAALAVQPAARPKPHVAPRARTQAPALLPTPDPAPAVQAAPPAPAAEPTPAEPSPNENEIADAAAPASAAPASDAASGAERIEPLPIEYLQEVSRMIRIHLQYPWQARRDRAEGTAVVHIRLARDGSVVSVSLVQGASNGALDEEACNVVLRIRKFPGLPEQVLRGGREFAIDQPIRFRRA